MLSREGSRLLSPRHVVHAQRFFDRHGPKAVVLARFVPLARTMTPVVAGVGSMSRRTVLGVQRRRRDRLDAAHPGRRLLFGGIPVVEQHVGLITLGIAALSATPVLWALARRALRARAAPRSRARRTPHPGRPRGELAACAGVR